MIKKIKPINLDIFSTFLEKNTALPVYSKIENIITNQKLYTGDDFELKKDCYIYKIHDFPSYLKGEINNKNWKVKIVNTYKGSLILLKNYKDTNDYLSKKFKTPKRFRIYKSKLETCFKIEYKTFFGEISKKEYIYHFNYFRYLLEQRFLEKNVENYDLSRWDIYEEITYDLINNKQAVLFVIYDDQKPISFYLNLLKGHTIFGYIKTYDIDYSKFSVGFISFMQQLQWCFDNNIEVYDLLKGNYPYKNKLIDSNYYYQKHILYNDTYTLTIIAANLMAIKIKLFYALVRLLKKIHVDAIYHKFNNYKYRNRIYSKTLKYQKALTIVDDYKIPSNAKMKALELHDKSSKFIKRSVYTFMYHNNESINSIKLYQLENEANSFIIKGKKQTQKIIF